MAALAGLVFFLGLLALAGWVIVDAVKPRLERIAFLLQYGPAIGAELPTAPRATVRVLPARTAPVQARAAPLPLRAAA